MSGLQLSQLFSVKDKVVLVTGGSRGIGLMIASTFVENGAKVYISSRKAAVCAEVAAELSKIGTCIAIPADLSSKAGLKILTEELISREDKLDVLINNAGAAWGAPFEEFPESGYDKVMDLNVKSVFYLTQSLMPLIKKSATKEDPARIINIGSIDGIRVPSMDNVPYTFSKAAVHHMSKVLSMKFAGKFITVNAIAPGPFPSKMTEFMLDKFQQQVEQMNPMRRIGQPGDMGGIALFLSSPAGAYINGTVIPVDGGFHLMGPPGA
ncbi:MAG: SDR family oxidoreductase [Bacteroidota bacterium]